MKASFRKSCLALLLLAGIVCGAAGCKTGDGDNMSARPWNAPKSWEHGVPSSLMEGR